MYNLVPRVCLIGFNGVQWGSVEAVTRNTLGTMLRNIRLPEAGSYLAMLQLYGNKTIA